jgi:hypothetical protein
MDGPEQSFRASLEVAADGLWWLTWQRTREAPGVSSGMTPFETRDAAIAAAEQLADGLEITWVPAKEV